MKRLYCIILILAFFSTLGIGQTPTIVLTNNSGDELPMPFAKQRRIYVSVDSIPNHWHCRIYSLKTGAMEKEYLCRTMLPDTIDGFFKSYTNKVLTYEGSYVNGRLNGAAKNYYDNGQLYFDGGYIDEKNTGQWKWYYPSGALMADLTYANDEIVSGQYYYENGKTSNRKLNADKVMPLYPGGQTELLKFMATAIYPIELRKEAIGGIVLVDFVIDTNGIVKDPSIIYSPDTLFSEAALAVINRMPKWEPGYKHMRTIEVHYKLPFIFKISDGLDLENLQSANNYYNQGEKAVEEGDYNEAYKMFSMAVYLNSKNMHFLLNKAITAINLGKVDEACSCIYFLSSSPLKKDVEPYLKYCR